MNACILYIISTRAELVFGSFSISWEQRKLTELVEFFSGLTYTPNDIQNNGTLVLRSSNVSNGEIVDADNVYVNPQVVNSENVKVGDIIVVVRNGSRSLIGKHAQIKASMSNTVIGAFMTGIRSDCPEFMNALLNTPKFEEEIAINMGATINQITGYMFSKMEFKVPCLDEQRRIGAYFENLDRLITLHQRKLYFYTTYNAVLPDNRDRLKTDAWEQRKLGDCFTERVESMPDGELISVTINDGIKKFSELGRHDNSNDDKSKYKKVCVGDIAYNSMRMWQGASGYSPYEGIVSPAYTVLSPNSGINSKCLAYQFKLPEMTHIFQVNSQGITSDNWNLKYPALSEIEIFVSSDEQEQAQIAELFQHIDRLITLHQRKSPSRKERRCVMIEETRGKDLFYEYYAKWITVYKKGAIRKVTMDKYLMTQKWLEKLIPDLRICDMNRIAYQQLLNDYAEFHERQTTMDFHHQLKGAILDAVDEGLIDRDPTRKAIIKGRTPAVKKGKYLNQFELHTLLVSLDLKNEVNWDYFILLVAKTGMRFSEALALTPKDFDFSHQTLSINKTWDYKGKGGFQPTKNKSSVRKIQIDWQTVIQFSELVKGMSKDQPIFVKANVYNSTVNDILRRYCEKCNIPVISVHGLRHTHASLLLFAGVSIASVARRLGHSSMTTTQKTYLHIIQELENKDIDLVMRSLSGLS